jgi:hypothetical protein
MNGTAAQEPIGKRAVHELREFLIVAAYFYVCFTALAYLKAAILQAHGIAFPPFGFARSQGSDLREIYEHRTRFPSW